MSGNFIKIFETDMVCKDTSTGIDMMACGLMIYQRDLENIRGPMDKCMMARCIREGKCSVAINPAIVWMFFVTYSCLFAHRPHGVGGTMTYTSYDVYKGGFQNGMKHGVGRMLFAAGGWTAEYSGQWNSDTMDGTGRIVFVNGDSYEGTFKRNQFQGSGVFKSSTGDVYTGQFEAGLQEGRGKMEFWNKCFYEGEWKGSKMHGIGKFTGADGHTYVGEWVDDKMEGHGKFTWANGDVYEGQFKANQMDGQGKITHKSGNVWTGSFKNDRKEGRGQALKTGNQGVHRV